VAEQGYAHPTPIQSQAIPHVLGGRDLLGAAQTGTGKTAGFALPMLQRLAAGSGTKLPRALIITPTRELAAQVHEDVRTYGKHLALRSAVIFGGVGMQPQIDALRRGLDIVVATPGRLLDHARQKTVDLRQIEILVLDEADRMLDMGFIPDIRRILALLPAKRQNLLFSATFPDEIRKLAATFLRNPATVEVARRNTPAELVEQCAYRVAKDRKRDLLAHLVKTGDWRQVLVFCKTKRGANRLAEQLERDGVEADAIHGNKSQNARTRALNSFKDGELRVLVATDIAARGLDIEQLPHVVNFDLPHVPEDYVHRIGRTGRAGSTGEAISLVCNEERPLLAAIEKLIGRRVEPREVPGFSSVESQSAAPRHADKAPAQPRHRAASRRPQRHSSPAPRAQDHRGQASQPPAQPAVTPGYRPLTAHAPTRRVPALLDGNRSKNS
jgi:ATP-dependent RNA helicase RhlE